jgi:hypothetical protein
MSIFFVDNPEASDDTKDGLQDFTGQVTNMSYTGSEKKLEHGTDITALKNNRYYRYVYLSGGGFPAGLYMVSVSAGSGTIRYLQTWDSTLQYGDPGYLPSIPGVLPAPAGNFSGISTGTGPKQTISAGVGLITAAGGDGHMLHIGSSTKHTESFRPDSGGSDKLWNTYWGFTDYPGDLNRHEIDGTGLSNAIDCVSVTRTRLRDFYIHSSNNANISTIVGSYHIMENILSKNAGAEGFLCQSGSNWTLYECHAEDNGTHGFNTINCDMIKCSSLSNGTTNSHYNFRGYANIYTECWSRDGYGGQWYDTSASHDNRNRYRNCTVQINNRPHGIYLSAGVGLGSCADIYRCVLAGKGVSSEGAIHRFDTQIAWGGDLVRQVVFWDNDAVGNYQKINWADHKIVNQPYPVSYEDENPRWRDPTSDDYTVNYNSPCLDIDAGVGTAAGIGVKRNGLGGANDNQAVHFARSRIPSAPT